MNDPQLLLELLALADIEIESGNTIPIEDVMKEFGLETKQTRPDEQHEDSCR
jgi:hypothetical protein